MNWSTVCPRIVIAAPEPAGPLSADDDAPRGWGPRQAAVGDDAVHARLIVALVDDAVGARRPVGEPRLVL